MERKFRPKTGQERGLQIGGLVCVCLTIPFVIMMAIPVGLIIDLIICLILWGVGATLLAMSMKKIKARVAAEEAAKANGAKPKTTTQAKPATTAAKPVATQAKPTTTATKPAEKPAGTPKPATTPVEEKKIEKPIEKPVEAKVSEPVIKSAPIQEEKKTEPIDDDPFTSIEKKETNKVEPASPSQKKSNKALIIILISIIAFLLIVVIILVVILKKPSKKAPFDSTSKVYYRNGNFIASFSPSGKAEFYYYDYINYDYYVTDVYKGSWDYDETTSTITATYKTMEWYGDEGWVKVNTKGSDYEEYSTFKFEFISDSRIACTYSYGYSTYENFYKIEELPVDLNKRV